MNKVMDLTSAYHFAAVQHVSQRRKGAVAEPYVNHVIEVANLVATATKGTDIELVMAAVLHDTVEDTATRFADLEEAFGQWVTSIVREVMDDKNLPKAERKRLQIQHAAQASTGAKIIKLADKTANLHALAASPPSTWPAKHIAEYVILATRVVDTCRGTNAWLEAKFDKACMVFSP
jgi:(p)ppGpp synthase/HD superfamily hydrolase